MTQAYRVQEAASETVTLAFKRHILQKSSGFASEPMADLYRVQLLGMMLDRYDELREKGLGELSGQNRVMHEFDDIAKRMREEGFEELEARDERNLSRWPQLGEEEVERYIRERDAYLHKCALGTLLCTACTAPMMVCAGLADALYSDFFAMFGLVGMFAMIGMGVYAMVTAVKPRDAKKIKKGKFSLSARLRRKLTQLCEDVKAKARRRKGRGVALIVTSVIPMFLGAAMQEMWYSDLWPLLGVAGMFVMIAIGVYELVMADGEKKTMKHLLDGEREE